MEHREIDLEASPVPEEEELDRTVMCELKGGSDRMVACELEAAEALAGLARYQSGRRPLAESDQPIATEPFQDYATTATTSPEKIEKFVEKIPSQSNSMGKSRMKLSEAEKEERKLRRVLANRESARQTIRRRKAMHLALTRKAADALEENEVLKKEKELAVEEYNTLKDKNELLKAHLAKIKMTEQREIREEPTASSSDHPCPVPTNTPVFLHNQPSIVPCFWPSILQSAENLQFQCGSGSNITTSSQFPIPYTHQVQENSSDINRQGITPLVVVAVPWMLPFLTHSSMPDFHSGSNNTLQNTHPSLLHEDNNQFTPSYNTNAEASNSTRPKSVGAQHLANLPTDDSSSGAGVGMLDKVQEPIVCSSKNDSSSAGVGMFNKVQESIVRPPKNAEDAIAATMARKRRKELMKLKNIHCHYDRVHYEASG